ncbi:hypothetical protein OUZ56_032705 [Daphnia magna]|uniref:Uncharacterized protein n=1 Tax=Daphnia magna TaxID=35525 RepID=A0ABQ9ZX65_9CRUS|nr:hypothetical protein OUZ56_032705 [Daphnia magna]
MNKIYLSLDCLYFPSLRSASPLADRGHLALSSTTSSPYTGNKQNEDDKSGELKHEIRLRGK